MTSRSQQDSREACIFFNSLATIFLAVSIILTGVGNLTPSSGSGRCVDFLKLEMHDISSVDSSEKTLFTMARVVSNLSNVPAESAYTALEELYSVPTVYKVNSWGYERIVPGNKTYFKFPDAMKVPYLLLNELALHLPESTKWQNTLLGDYKKTLLSQGSLRIETQLKAGDIKTDKLVSRQKLLFWWDLVCMSLLILICCCTFISKADQKPIFTFILSFLSLAGCIGSITLQAMCMASQKQGALEYFKLLKLHKLHLVRKVVWTTSNRLGGFSLGLKVLVGLLAVFSFEVAGDMCFPGTAQ